MNEVLSRLMSTDLPSVETPCWGSREAVKHKEGTMQNASKPVAEKSAPDRDVRLMNMSLQQFRRIRTRSRIRSFLIRPIVALRMTMLKLALATCSLGGMTIEAIPAYHLGDPVPDQYHTCIRTKNGMARLVAEATVQVAATCEGRYEGRAAFSIRIHNVRLPDYPIKTRWIEVAKPKEVART